MRWRQPPWARHAPLMTIKLNHKPKKIPKNHRPLFCKLKIENHRWSAMHDLRRSTQKMSKDTSDLGWIEICGGDCLREAHVRPSSVNAGTSTDASRSSGSRSRPLRSRGQIRASESLIGFENTKAWRCLLTSFGFNFHLGGGTGASEKLNLRNKIKRFCGSGVFLLPSSLTS